MYYGTTTIPVYYKGVTSNMYADVVPQTSVSDEVLIGSRLYHDLIWKGDIGAVYYYNIELGPDEVQGVYDGTVDRWANAV